MFDVQKEEKYALVRVKADKLNSAVAPGLKSEFVKITSEGLHNIILDLSDTKYCDSSGLSAILVGNRVCKNSNGTFVVANAKGMVRKLIDISQLDSILHITPTVEEARDLVYMEEVEREINDE